MKGCIVLQGNNSKISHAIAMQLLKLGEVDEFCCYIFSPHAKNFITKQNEIRYTRILVDHELHKNIDCINLDYEYINEFEKKYTKKSLWSFFYSDRKLILSTPPKDETTMEIDSFYDYETTLKTFISRAKPIEKMIDEEKPDFILFVTVGALAHQILYNVAKKKNIKTFVIHNSRIGNKITVSKYFETISGAEELYENPKKIEKENLDEAAEIIDNFKKNGSLNLEYFSKTQRIIKKKVNKIQKIINSITWIIQLTKNYIKEKDLFVYGVASINPILFIYYKLKRKIRSLSNYKKLYYDYENKNEKFAFYPLHLEPEMAILTFAHYYINQAALIEQIAMSLPIGMKLYIKDHPMMKNNRPKKYFKKLLKIPNVRIIDPDTKSFDIIKKASIIITTTSTTGWEASILGKPVITFGDVFYNILPNVKKNTEIEKLTDTIKDMLKNNYFDEEKTRRLVAALIQDSENINIHSLWYEDFDKIKNDSGIKNFAKFIAKKIR